MRFGIHQLTMTRGISTTNYTYDRADRILTANPISYTVDENGNLTARGSDSFSYDQANRLITATMGLTATSTYRYDGDGKRASKTAGGSTTSYVYDANRSLPVVLDDGSRKYVWGVGLAYAVDVTGTVSVYHTDGLGSVRAMTDGSGIVVQTYRADEFGVAMLTQGSSGQPFQYTGEQRDSESAFYYLRARAYDPYLGRFLSRDPVFGLVGSPLSLNRYGYVLNNPMTLVDPSGLGSSRVLDTPCASTASGTFGGYVINAGCLETPFGTIVVALVETTFGLRVVSVLVAATPPREGSPSGDTDSEEDLVPTPSLRAHVEALKKVFAEVGRLPRSAPGKFGSPQRGTPKKGYRLDPPHPEAPPGSAESKYHYNWWDYTAGKKGRGGRWGAIPIED